MPRNPNPDIALSNPGEIPGRFPLPLEVIESRLQQLAGFNGPEMTYVAGSNQQLGEPYGPLDHAWNFIEDPAISSLVRFEGPPYSFTARLGPMRRYRAALCVGDLLVRGQEEALDKAGRGLDPVLLDPLRRYLVFPEDPTSGNFARHHTEQITGNLTEVYLGRAIQHGYLAKNEAVQAFQTLRDAWMDSRLDFLFDTDSAYAEANFGELCRGIFQIFRLYRIGEHEGRLAPWQNATYDFTKHFRLDDGTVPGHELFRLRRRWSARVRIAGETDVYESAYVPDMPAVLPLGATAIGISHFLSGYVGSRHSAELQAVGFRRSVREIALRPGDTAVVHYDDGTYAPLRAPFQNTAEEKGDAEIVALCRNRRLIPLSEPYDYAEATEMTTLIEENLAA